jgi:hypothetical protein
MIPIIKSRIIKESSPFGTQGFHIDSPLIHRLRNMNHKAVDRLSTLLVSLFADFYPTLKH